MKKDSKKKTTTDTIEVSNKDLERLEKLRPMDDDFMRCIFRDNRPLAEDVLRIFLEKPELRIQTVETQRDLKRLVGARSLELDVYCVDTEGKRYDLEVQRSAAGAGRKRARYHSSAIDVENLRAGMEFRELPEANTIFITETDVVGGGFPRYHVERTCLETGETWGDGGNILYVNGSYRADTELGRLMEDFQNPDPDTMYNPQMRETVRYFKKTKEGIHKMCEIFDEIRQEGILIGEKRGEKRGMKKGRLRGAVEIMREDGRSDAEIEQRLMDKYGVSKKKALKAMATPMA
ncbi:MAG: PD-(D/E)XK nuclease family transposase [bacterium]